MDEFEIIITHVEDGSNVKIEPGFEQSISSTLQHEKNVSDEKSPSQKMSRRAMLIIGDIEEKRNTDYIDIFGDTDISNDIVEGREVVVSNKIIKRAYALFSELMKGTPISISNINIATIYACKTVDFEYIKTWKDKQSLVFILMRRYIAEYTSVQEQSALHVVIESYVPIVLEKILHPKKRFKWPSFKCCHKIPWR